MTAIVLLNTGTPRSCQPKDVKRYLHEFLLDDRVLDYPSWLRNLLVKGIIVPLRHKKSAKAYARIWQESGSPLMTNSQALAEKLQGALNIPVAVAMRYGEPSIHSVLNSLQKCKPKQICFVPLFPQYASATTGSIFEEIFQTLSKWQVIPSITTVGPFADHPLFLKACVERAREIPIQEYDHVLFSFHGLPEKHIKRADSSGCCLKKGCCAVASDNNHFCYRAQCETLAKKMASFLGIQSFTICYQSRLGFDDWLSPYTIDVVKTRRLKGDKRLLVFSPSFVADCLETTYEIGIEARDEFIMQGGEALDLVTSLNTHPEWVSALAEIIKEHLPLYAQRTEEPRLVYTLQENRDSLSYT